MNTKMIRLLSLMFFIGEVGLESQHTQSDLIETLSNYHGKDGHEQITPIGVIQEIYFY